MPRVVCEFACGVCGKARKLKVRERGVEEKDKDWIDMAVEALRRLHAHASPNCGATAIRMRFPATDKGVGYSYRAVSSGQPPAGA